MKNIVVKRVINGEMVEIKLTEEEMRDTYYAYQEMCAESDIEDLYEAEYDGEDGEAFGLTREQFEAHKTEIVDKYQDYLAVDDSWNICARNAIEDIAEEIGKED